MVRTGRFLVTLVGLGLCACSDSTRSTPTAPSLDQALPAAMFWRGTITLEDAAPHGSCLADGFHAIGGDRERPARADSSALTSSSTWLHLYTSTVYDFDGFFDNPADPYDGFFPAESYEGRRGASGAFHFRSSSAFTEVMRSSVSSASLCTPTWQRLGSELTGTFSADRTRFQGEIVTRYREIDAGSAEFSVRAHFELRQTSYEESFGGPP